MKQAYHLDALDQENQDGVVVFSRNHVKRDTILIGSVQRIRSIVLFKTRAILWLWFLIPCVVSYCLPSMPLPLGLKGMVAYTAWVLFGVLLHHTAIRKLLHRETYPTWQDHLEGFPVGFQADFWQWKLFAESREDLREISTRLEIVPCPTMSMKSIPPGGFGMVAGTENPNEPACVIFPTKPSETQMGFSRKAHRGVLIHECGHIVLSTGLWMRRFELLNLLLTAPMAILFTCLIGQIAAYQGMSQENWSLIARWLFVLQVPLIIAIMFGKLGERIISRIHEFGCDSITAVYGEGEGLVEAFHGFAKFTKSLVSKLPWNKKLAWYVLKVPYREVWGTHPNHARRIYNCRSYMH